VPRQYVLQDMEAPLGLSEHAQKQACVPRTSTTTMGHTAISPTKKRVVYRGYVQANTVHASLLVVHGCRNTARLSRSNLNHPKLQPCLLDSKESNRAATLAGVLSRRLEIELSQTQ
jgi:hypothetical protein